jgi:hypothetical protein
MAEATQAVTIEVPKSVLQAALSKRPKWLKLSDEEFLLRLLINANSDAYVQTLKEAGEELAEIDHEHRRKLKELEGKLGFSIDAATASMAPRKPGRVPKAVAANATPVPSPKAHSGQTT